MGNHRGSDSHRENPNYKVGYCRPPHEYDYPKGKSGNPRGRPRKEPPSDLNEAVATTFNKLDHQNYDGKPTAGLRLFARQVIKKALRGDYQAYLLIKACAEIVTKQQQTKREQEQWKYFESLRQELHGYTEIK